MKAEAKPRVRAARDEQESAPRAGAYPSNKRRPSRRSQSVCLCTVVSRRLALSRHAAGSTHTSSPQHRAVPPRRGGRHDVPKWLPAGALDVVCPSGCTTRNFRFTHFSYDHGCHSRSAYHLSATCAREFEAAATKDSSSARCLPRISVGATLILPGFSRRVMPRAALAGATLAPAPHIF